jgi:hypothetical protein
MVRSSDCLTGKGYIALALIYSGDGRVRQRGGPTFDAPVARWEQGDRGVTEWLDRAKAAEDVRRAYELHKGERPCLLVIPGNETEG